MRPLQARAYEEARTTELFSERWEDFRPNRDHAIMRRCARIRQHDSWSNRSRNTTTYVERLNRAASARYQGWLRERERRQHAAIAAIVAEMSELVRED